MGLFGRKSQRPFHPPVQDLRADLDKAVWATPPKVSQDLLRSSEVLNYLNERVPEDETIESIAVCGSSISEYLAGASWRGCLLLTDKRLVLARSNSDTGEIRVLALPFADITSFSFEKINVRSVPGCEVSIGYGAGQTVEVPVDEDTGHAVEFLQQVQDRLNTSGRYGL
jgi:hypothetical protein